MSMAIPTRDFEVIPWSASFETGFAEIDGPRRQLVCRIDRLTRGLAQGQGDHFTADQFDALLDYADDHFTTEEKLWDTWLAGDERLASHQHAHREFIDQVLQYRAEAAWRSPGEMAQSLVHFLTRWLVCHVLDDEHWLAHMAKATKAGASRDEAASRADREVGFAKGVLTDSLLAQNEQLSSRVLELQEEIKGLNQIKQELRAAPGKDAVTGLPNAALFEQLLEWALTIARRDETPFALLWLAAEANRVMEDQWGPPAHDLLMRELAHRLRATLRASDLIARMAGDEFLILARGVSCLAEAATLGDRLHLAIRPPFQILGQPCSLRISMGMVLYPEHGTHVHTLVRRAREAPRSSLADGDHASLFATELAG